MSFWERLDKYIRGGPSAIEGPFALLPRLEFDREVTGALTERLGGLGFSQVGKRRWTRENAPSILALIELQSLKSEVVPVWGVSLDYVPHVKGNGEIAWHRTPSSARYDLSYQPLDYEQDLRPWEISRFSTREELSTEAGLFASRVSESAARFLDPLTCSRAVLEAVETKRSRPYIRLGFDHYPQEMLAYTFLLARCGEQERSNEALARFVEQHHIPRDTQARLQSLLSQVQVVP